MSSTKPKLRQPRKFLESLTSVFAYPQDFLSKKDENDSRFERLCWPAIDDSVRNLRQQGSGTRRRGCGADIVVMHGAPVVHGVEIYHHRPIFYDLGNFIFNLPLTSGLDELIIWESVVAYLEYQGKNLQSITFRPIFLNKLGEGQPDAPNGHTKTFSWTHAAYPSQRLAIRHERLADASRSFGTTVAVINLKGRN